MKMVAKAFWEACGQCRKLNGRVFMTRLEGWALPLWSLSHCSFVCVTESRWEGVFQLNTTFYSVLCP